MARLIQICASENDLFALDGEGIVYQFDFSTNDWVKLGRHETPRLRAAGRWAAPVPKRRALGLRLR
jgi:hypothetical protein